VEKEEEMKIIFCKFC